MKITGKAKNTRIEEEKKRKLIPLKCEAGHNTAASSFLNFEDGTRPIPLCEMHAKIIRETLEMLTLLQDKSVKADLDLQEANKTVEQLKKDATFYEEEIVKLEQRIDEQHKKTKDLEEEISNLHQNAKKHVKKE